MTTITPETKPRMASRGSQAPATAAAGRISRAEALAQADLLLSVAAVDALERVVWTFHFNSSRNRPADNQRAMFYSHKEIWYE
jgi:hypothetical protein